MAVRTAEIECREAHDAVEVLDHLSVPFLRFVPAGHRLRVEIVLLGGRRAIDVSVQPGAAVALITDHARDSGADPNRLLDDVGQAVMLLGRRAGVAWAPLPSTSPLAVIGGVSHPVLGMAYDRGAAAVGDIPLWAAPVLAAADPRKGAAVVVNRPPPRHLVRALAMSLLPRGGDGEQCVALDRLALALVGARACAGDHLVDVLERPGPLRPRWALPNVDDVTTARRAIALLRPPQAARLLADAVDDPDALRVYRVLGAVAQLRHRLSQPLPGRLDGLDGCCRAAQSMLPVSAGSPPAPVTEEPVPTRPLRPPPARHGRLATTLCHPPRLAVLDGQRVGELVLRLPRDAEMLASWGAALDNCLASFAAAVDGGQSWLVGIELDHRVVGCVEITPATRRLRQALGRANRPLPEAHVRPVLHALARAGLLCP